MSRRRRRPLWRNCLLAVVCAALTFGGTFTCRGESNSSDFTRNPRTGAG